METKLDKSDYLLLAIIYGITVILNIYEYYVNGNDLIEYFVDIPAGILVSFAVVLIFFYWLIPEYLFKKKRIVIFVVFGILTLSLLGMLDYTLGFWSGGNDWNKFPKPLNLFVEGIFDASTDGGFTFGILLAKKFYEGRTKFISQQKQLQENELKLLRSQLDPHFLFNNLNTLDALIDSDADKAKEYINRLSLIYRYLIHTKDAEVMELSEEMNLAENYIFLIQTRFGDDYDFHVNKHIGFSDKFLPTGAVQALLENVVKHNKVSGENKIQVSIDIDEDWLTVINKKSKLKQSQDTLGTGLINLKARYQLLSEEKPHIVESQTEYKISIPIIKLSN